MALRDLAFDVLFIGHSLVGPVMPGMLESAVFAMGGSGQVESQILNGTPLAIAWDASAQAEGVDAREVLPTGEYEIVVMTEALPLGPNVEYWDTPLHLRNFYDLAVSNQPDVQVYLYETWHSINSGTGVPIEHDNEDHIPWRERIDNDLAVWTGVIEEVNAGLGPDQPPVRLVPAGQAMGLLYDRIEAGEVPGLTDISDVFIDDIHPNSLGNYFLALVHFSTLYGLDPAPLPRALGARPVPSQELADAMQEIAWEAVRSAPGTGLD